MGNRGERGVTDMRNRGGRGVTDMQNRGERGVTDMRNRGGRGVTDMTRSVTDMTEGVLLTQGRGEGKVGKMLLTCGSFPIS